MSKWIEIEIDLKFAKYFSQFKSIEDEVELIRYKQILVFYIYKNIDTWMKKVLKNLIELEIPFSFVPVDYERYNTESIYNENFTSFDYKVYSNLNALITKQIEVRVNSKSTATSYWSSKFSYSFNSLIKQIQQHIDQSKPKQKNINLSSFEYWEDRNPFSNNPWDGDLQEKLDVYLVDKSGFCSYINQKHPSYKLAQEIIGDLEKIEFIKEQVESTFKKFDTNKNSDRTTLCFLVTLLEQKVDMAVQILDDDIRDQLRPLLSNLNHISSKDHFQLLIPTVELILQIIMRPNHESLMPLSNLLSQDETMQADAIVSLAKLYSNNYEKDSCEYFLNSYKDFCIEALKYLQSIKLISFESQQEILKNHKLI